MLLTTNYLFGADELRDRIAVIRSGAIVAEGTPRELKAVVDTGHVLEIEVYGLPDEVVTGLSGLPGVRSAAVEERGLRQMLVTQCLAGSEITQSVLSRLEQFRVARVTTREPTLEDAYVQLVTS